MIKLKTKKAVLKRIKVKLNKLQRKKAYKGHLLRKKNARTLRKLSLQPFILNSNIKEFYKMLPYNN